VGGFHNDWSLQVLPFCGCPSLEEQLSILNRNLKGFLIAADARRGHVLTSVQIEADFVARTNEQVAPQPSTGKQTTCVVAPIVKRPVAVGNFRYHNVGLSYFEAPDLAFGEICRT
jgi:hypothetical protein